MKAMQLLTEIFTWWNGSTVGTRVHTWRHGELVGTDEFGNRYYRTRGGAVDPALGLVRRWVIYPGPVEASLIPPGWRGWLAHTHDLAPSEEEYRARDWELGHLPNMTGTSQAYRPQGSLLAAGERPAATGDYVPWTPGQ
jgi:NADH:ubiquinone oxidoreductase subunit